MHRIRTTALPLLALGVCTGLVMPSTPATAVTRPAAVASASAVAPIARLAVTSAASKPRIAPPAHVTVHEFEQGKVTTSWSRVRGVRLYQVHVYKIDPKSKFIYPFNKVPGSEYLITTKKLSYTFVNNFSPRSDAKRLQALPWIITVAAKSPNGAHRDSSPKAPTVRIHDKIVFKTIVIKKNATAKQKRGYRSVVQKCAAEGLAAGVGTAAAGGLVALASIWIPGVDAVSWPAVAVAAVSVGSGATFACLLKDKINPGPDTIHGSHLRVV